MDKDTEGFGQTCGGGPGGLLLPVFLELRASRQSMVNEGIDIFHYNAY